MRPPLSQTPIRSKISTMPRPKTEAAAYLNIYKLVTERKRLEQELEGLEQRRDRILKRLDDLTVQVAALEANAHGLRENPPPPAQPALPSRTSPADGFNTLFLEY